MVSYQNNTDNVLLSVAVQAESHCMLEVHDCKSNNLQLQDQVGFDDLYPTMKRTEFRTNCLRQVGEHVRKRDV